VCFLNPASPSPSICSSLLCVCRAMVPSVHNYNVWPGVHFNPSRPRIERGCWLNACCCCSAGTAHTGCAAKGAMDGSTTRRESRIPRPGGNGAEPLAEKVGCCLATLSTARTATCLGRVETRHIITVPAAALLLAVKCDGKAPRGPSGGHPRSKAPHTHSVSTLRPLSSGCTCQPRQQRISRRRTRRGGRAWRRCCSSSSSPRGSAQGGGDMGGHCRAHRPVSR
jgi:hypothetical protein